MAEKKYAGYFNQFDWPWYMPTIEEYEKLQLSDDALRDILKNGPYITEFLNSLKICFEFL